jgi:hypothetical protein
LQWLFCSSKQNRQTGGLFCLSKYFHATAKISSVNKVHSSYKGQPTLSEQANSNQKLYQGQHKQIPQFNNVPFGNPIN